MNAIKSNQEINDIIGQFFDYESITYGSEKQPFITRYQGKLKNEDSAVGFDQISRALEPLDLIASLRLANHQHDLIVLRKKKVAKKKRISMNLIMFLLTVLSVLFTGGLYSSQGDIPAETIPMIWTLIKSGWPFALSMLAILSAHEFGHYFAGKKNGVDVTLPFFIPFPFSSFGTMGAFINMRSIPKNKWALFDIAIAGPLSGLIVSIPILIIGMKLSELSTIPLASDVIAGMQMEGNSLLYLFMKYLIFGKLLPKPDGLKGLVLFVYWIRYFLTGLPFPWGAEDVMLHPVAWAGWAGLFVTAINLLPVGQLDGGHIFQMVFGKKAAQFIFPFIIGGLAILGIFWNGWWLWAGILFFMRSRYAEPLDQVTQLDSNRRWLGYLAVMIFILTFVPVPISIVGF